MCVCFAESGRVYKPRLRHTLEGSHSDIPNNTADENQCGSVCVRDRYTTETSAAAAYVHVCVCTPFAVPEREL